MAIQTVILHLSCAQQSWCGVNSNQRQCRIGFPKQLQVTLNPLPSSSLLPCSTGGHIRSGIQTAMPCWPQRSRLSTRIRRPTNTQTHHMQLGTSGEMTDRDCYSPTTGPEDPSDPMANPSASSSFDAAPCDLFRREERRMRARSGRAKPSREDKEYTKPRPRVRSSSVGRRGPSGDWGLGSRARKELLCCRERKGYQIQQREG